MGIIKKFSFLHFLYRVFEKSVTSVTNAKNRPETVAAQ